MSRCEQIESYHRIGQMRLDPRMYIASNAKTATKSFE